MRNSSKSDAYWYMPHIRCWSNQTIDNVLELIIPTHIKISLKVHVNWMTKDERSFSSNGNIFLVWVIFIWTRCNNLKCFVQPLSLERLFQVNINNRTQHCFLPSDIVTLIPYPYIFLFDIKKRISYIINFSTTKINFQRDMSRVTAEVHWFYLVFEAVFHFEKLHLDEESLFVGWPRVNLKVLKLFPIWNLKNWVLL